MNVSTFFSFNQNVFFNAVVMSIACIPTCYILIGALTGFSDVFKVVIVPPYILSLFILCMLHVSNFSYQPKPIISGVCLTVTLFVTYLISDFNLQSIYERVFLVMGMAFSMFSFWILLLAYLARKKRV